MLILLLTLLGAEAADSKPQSRWSLSEWMEQRDKMRMQDIWLALHSASPYEFFLGGNYQVATRTPGGNDPGWRGEFAAYASIFGLQAEYESTQSYARQIGHFNFRFFGPRAQGTNITFQLGIRNQTEGLDTFRNLFAGLAFTLYMTRFFGVEGSFKHHLDSTPSGLADKVASQTFTGSAFIEFNFFRFYLSYLAEPETRTIGGTPSARLRTGALVGGRFYF